MAPSIIQSAVPATQTLTSVNRAFPSNVTAGSMLGAILYVRDTTTGQVSDTQSNAWNICGNPHPGTFPDNSRQCVLLTAENAKAGATTVTGTSSGGTAQIDMMIFEASGFTSTGLLEAISYTFSNAGTPFPRDTGPITTARNPNALVIAGFVTRDAIVAGSTGTDGYTIMQDGTAFASNSSKYKVVSSTGSQSSSTATDTGSVGCWMVIAAFSDTTSVGTLGQYVTHHLGRGAGW